MESEEVCLNWNNFSSNLTTNIDEFWKNENYVDVTIYCEGKFIQAHRIILAASSATFKNIFNINPHQNPLIVLQDVKYRELAALITFIYKGEVIIEQQNLPNLLKAAETLQIHGLYEYATKSNRTEIQSNLETALKKRKIDSQSNTSCILKQENKIDHLGSTNDKINLEYNQLSTEVFIKSENFDDDSKEESGISPLARFQEEEKISNQSLNEFGAVTVTPLCNYGAISDPTQMESSEASNNTYFATTLKNIRLVQNSGKSGNVPGSLSRLEVRHSKHWPSKCSGNQKRCRVCSRNKITRRSSYYCKVCEVGLCVVECFEKWHTDMHL